jgi:hypothetical protein
MCEKVMKALLATLLKCALVLTLLTAALVGAVRALPYDRSREEGRRDFLFPAGCAPPCVMGMTPGVTTWEDTRQRVDEFDARGWINHDGFFENGGSTDAMMFWQWNTSPEFPYGYDTRAGRDFDLTNWVTFADGYVDTITIITNFTYSDVQFTFGRASDLLFYVALGQVTFRYEGLQATYDIGGRYCLHSKYPLFEMPTNLSFGRGAGTSNENGILSISPTDFGRSRRLIDQSLTFFCD